MGKREGGEEHHSLLSFITHLSGLSGNKSKIIRLHTKHCSKLTCIHALNPFNTSERKVRILPPFF